jgi:hypothetical protein
MIAAGRGALVGLSLLVHSILWIDQLVFPSGSVYPVDNLIRKLGYLSTNFTSPLDG